jgi:hypothetical protein
MAEFARVQNFFGTATYAAGGIGHLAKRFAA